MTLRSLVIITARDTVHYFLYRVQPRKRKEERKKGKEERKNERKEEKEGRKLNERRIHYYL